MPRESLPGRRVSRDRPRNEVRPFLRLLVRLQRMPAEIADDGGVHRQPRPFGAVRGGPVGEEPVHLGELEHRAHDTHQGAARDEARGDERAAVEACLVEGFVLRAGRDVPRHQTARHERRVERHGDEHAQREGEGGHADDRQQEGDRRAVEVEHPRGLFVCLVGLHPPRPTLFPGTTLTGSFGLCLGTGDLLGNLFLDLPIQSLGLTMLLLEIRPQILLLFIQ